CRTKGRMGRSPRRGRRFRVASPVDIRGWVDAEDLDAEGIYRELSCRINALDAVGKQCGELLLQGGRRLATETIQRLGRDAKVRDVTSEEEGAVVGVGAAKLVAAFWSQQEDSPGRLLPPIMISGVPWDPLPDHVHVFDLTPGQIRQAAPDAAAIRQWRRAQ